MKYFQIVRISLTPSAQLKTIYDRLGKEALSSGFNRGDKNVFVGYKYLGNANDIFLAFTQKYLPFHNLFDSNGDQL
jgi:DnaJ homolog subfamily B member 13